MIYDSPIMIFIVIRFGRKKMMFLSMGIAAIATLASAYVHSYPIFLMLRFQKYILHFVHFHSYTFIRSLLFPLSRAEVSKISFSLPFLHQTSGCLVVLEPWELLSPCAYLPSRSQDPGNNLMKIKMGYLLDFYVIFMNCSQAQIFSGQSGALVMGPWPGR